MTHERAGVEHLLALEHPLAKEAELAEWFTSLSLLQPLPAEGTIAEVQDAAMEPFSNIIYICHTV